MLIVIIDCSRLIRTGYYHFLTLMLKDVNQVVTYFYNSCYMQQLIGVSFIIFYE